MQNQVFIPCQSNGGIPDFSLHSFCIKGQVLKAKYFAIVGGGRLLKAPEHCFNPHQKLLIVEWLQEQSYEVKRGKYVSFRAPGQERFTRCKTLGETYTEEAIIERIKGRFVERKPKENRKISLRIDLENSIKAQQSAAYEKWAKLHNLKQAARTLNFLTEHEIESYPDLESRVAEITAASTEAAAALKAAERRLAEMSVLIKDVATYKELRPLVQEYQRAADKKQFRRRHEGTLILYEAAAKALKEQGFQKLPDLYALKDEHKLLAEQKDQLQRQYAEAKRQMQEYGIIKQNVDGVLFQNHRQERDKTM